MDKNTEELLRLIILNPELPVVPIVNYEVCGTDDYCYWMGHFSSPRVDEYMIDHWYGDECVRFKSEKDDETIIEGIAECKFGDCTKEENWQKAEEYLKSLWKKAIIVYIDAFEEEAGGGE